MNCVPYCIVNVLFVEYRQSQSDGSYRARPRWPAVVLSERDLPSMQVDPSPSTCNCGPPKNDYSDEFCYIVKNKEKFITAYFVIRSVIYRTH